MLTQSPYAQDSDPLLGLQDHSAFTRESKWAMRSTPWVIGIDPGQSVDPTAIAVARAIELDNRQSIQIAHLERMRLGTSYTDVVRRALDLRREFPGADLVVDASGVGAAVFDSLREAGAQPIGVVIIHGSHHATREAAQTHRVAKQALIETLQTALRDGVLKIPKALAETPALLDELRNFWGEHTGRGNLRLSGHTDDLVLAVSLAVWRLHSSFFDGRFLDGIATYFQVWRSADDEPPEPALPWHRRARREVAGNAIMAAYLQGRNAANQVLVVRRCDTCGHAIGGKTYTSDGVNWWHERCGPPRSRAKGL